MTTPGGMTLRQSADERHGVAPRRSSTRSGGWRLVDPDGGLSRLHDLGLRVVVEDLVCLGLADGARARRGGGQRGGARPIRVAPDDEAVVISCTNRSAPNTAASSGFRTLSATLRLCFRSSARYTVAIPPCPSSRSMR